MGDGSLKVPVLESSQDMLEADHSNGHSAPANVSEGCRLRMKMGDPLELPSSPVDSQYSKMGDGLLKAPVLEPSQEILEADHSNGHFAPVLEPSQEILEVDNSNGHFAPDNVSEDCALRMKMGDPSELQSSPVDFQRMEEHEPHSGKDLVQPKPEAAQSDLSDLKEKTSVYGYPDGNTEEHLVGDGSQHWSRNSISILEQDQQIGDDEVDARKPTNMQQSPSIYEIPEREESAALEHLPSTQFTDNPRAINQELRNCDGDYVLSKSASASEKTEADYLEEKRGGPGEESVCLDGMGSSSNCYLPVNEGGQQQTQTDDEVHKDSEILALSMSTARDEEHAGFQNEMDSFLDPSNQEWSDLDFGEATLISTDIDGWQRFDKEDVNNNTDHTQGTDEKGGTWEQLLDDGLDSIRRDAVQPLQLALPTPLQEKHFELPSPGNPFMEELERASSFSEADDFVHGKDLPTVDRQSQVSEEPPPLRLKEGFFDGGGQADQSGMTIVAEFEQNNVKKEPVNVQETKLRLQSSTSLDFMEPFEAPSFMSLVDPKSHALFEACMPTYQANRPMSGHENHGEKWVADFDLVAPSTQEITRSISFPRPGSDTPGQRPGQSVSFTVNREQESSSKESHSPSANRSLGFLSPKFSPLVQKVVAKVRSTPAVANGMFNTVRQAMSPKASDNKKSTLGSLLTRCMCW